MCINKIIFLKQLFFGLLFSAVLTSCGFQLRGAYKLPAAMQTTFIEAGQDNSELVRALKRSLKASDIVLLDEVSSEAAILKLGGEQKSKRTVSVDAQGRAREYTLTYSVSFSVKAAELEFEMPEQTIKIERDFLFDTEDVLGKSREESQLYKEMQQDIVRLILLRLQSKAQI